MKRIISIFGLLLFLFSSAEGQTDTSIVYSILTTDGNQYFGRIISSDDNVIELRTENLGLLKIPVIDIKSREVVTPRYSEKGEISYWPENHHATRYFFGPNGYGLRKGEGYYQNNWVLFNQVSYGVTDNFAIGLGTIPLFLFGSPSTPFWITPKASFEIVEEKFSLGVGTLAGAVIGQESVGFGVAYGTATVGSRNKNLSLGLGYGYSSYGWAESPTVSLSGMTRIGKKLYLITENYWFGFDQFGLLSFGARTAWPNIALDYGLIVPVAEGYVELALPWLGVSIPFGKR